MAFLKAIIFFDLLLMLVGCGARVSRDTVTPFDYAKVKRDKYLEQLNYNNVTHGRCDGLTFRAVLDSLKRISIYNHEYPAGKWNRDKDVCWPKDSRSEISREGYINLFHALLSRGKEETIEATDRIIAYGLPRGFVMGEGSLEYTDIKVLVPVMYELRGEASLTGSIIDEITAVSQNLEKYFTTYRAYVIAQYIYLRGRINGKISEIEYQLLKKYVELNPNDPYFLALKHRFLDGDQLEAVSLLNDDDAFPFNTLPDNTKYFSWQGAHHSLLFCLTVAILEGM